MSLTALAHMLDQSSITARERFKFLKDGKNILLYGAGTVGRDLFLALESSNYVISGFLDRDARPGQTLGGLPVWSPEDASLDGKKIDTHVIVTIFNPFTDVSLVFRQLKAAGWFSVTSIVEIYQLLPDLAPRLWLAPSTAYLDKAKEILSVENIWCDEKSHTLYRANIEFRLSGNYDLLPSPDSRQYFPADVPSWKVPLRLVDCGAFDGDTLRFAEELSVPFEAIAAFEPDLDNYQALVAQRNSAYFRRIETSLWPCGVHSRTVKLKFSSGMGTSSRVSEDAVDFIQCVAIDDCLGQFRPNLIKMDIEGAEYAALQGAANTIASCRPGIAVSLYHRPDDIWRIPALIQSWDLGYRFYLRIHAHSGFELVLYAIP